MGRERGYQWLRGQIAVFLVKAFGIPL